MAAGVRRKEIGSGASGTCVRVETGSLSFVVKKALDAEGREDLKREERSLRKLTSSHTVRLLQVDHRKGKIAISDGGSDLLTRFTDVYRSLPKQELDEKMRLIAFQVLIALHESHSKRIVHCDIKPENIFVDEHDFVRLGDFGSAATIGKHMTMCTMEYAPQVVADSFECGARIKAHPEFDLISLAKTVSRLLFRTAHLKTAIKTAEGKTETLLRELIKRGATAKSVLESSAYDPVAKSEETKTDDA